MTSSATSQRNRLVIAAVLFLFSGFSALVYQVIWQRILGIFSGVHIYSVTLIVTAFMAGLGLGSLLGGWISDRSSRKTSLALFALCELGIGLFELASPWVLLRLCLSPAWISNPHPRSPTDRALRLAPDPNTTDGCIPAVTFESDRRRR